MQIKAQTFLTLLILTALTLAACVPVQAPAASQPAAAGLANPASQNCLAQGGKLEIEERGDSGQFGVCFFEDNRQCEEWALMRGMCPQGGIRVTGYVTPAARYCAITGGEYAITANSGAEDEQGRCTFQDGSQCDAWDYYNGRCSPPVAAVEPAAAADPLPSWMPGPVKSTILQFVADVTDSAGASYVPPEERVAVFDNDGTLWIEKPIPAQVAFVFARIQELAAEHPEWKTAQPYQAVLEQDAQALATLSEDQAAELIAVTHAGMTVEEFTGLAQAFLTTARHPLFNALYTETVYQPMLELLALLRANGFKTFIVSGGGVDFMRAFSEEVYGIPPENVIGSSLQYAFRLTEEGPVLLRMAEIVTFDNAEEKPVNIQRVIGRRPILAAGNSDGDLAMFQYTGAGAGPSLVLLLVHDDAEREYEYLEGAEVVNAAAAQSPWRFVSMKRDFARMFPFDTAACSAADCAPVAAPPAAEPESLAAEVTPLAVAVSDLEPHDVWQNFYRLTQVPRPSGHDEQVRAFLVQFGRELGLETSVDDAGNVLIRRPAAEGFENRQGVVLQAHMDMVPQKTADKAHDFTTDPIQAVVDGEWVRADGTTLGADDGIGIAVAMAVLQSKTLRAGPIEALFTVDEESTMAGVLGLRPGLLQGEILINLDGEEEGTFTIGSAGGATASIKTLYAEEAVPEGMAAYVVSIRGLRGGHSGIDINLGRGNAIKLLARFLIGAAAAHTLRISEIEGGSAHNAIPREASALVCVPQAQQDSFLSSVKEFEKTIRQELAAVEPELRVQADAAALPARVMDGQAQRTLLAALYATPQGVIRMSDAVPGLVETSANVGVVQGREGQLDVTCLVRSAVVSSLDDTAVMVSSLWGLAGGEVVIKDRYAGWAPNADSPIVGLVQQVYQEMYGHLAQVTAVHAGLECGTVVARYPGMDAISLGPTLHDVHSPDEALQIASVQKLMSFLLQTLARIPIRQTE